jgi:spore germination protein YaaH
MKHNIVGRVVKKILVYILIFLAGFFAGFGFYYFKDTVLNKTTDTTSETKKTSKPENKFTLSRNVAASLVWWDQDEGYASIQENKELISTIKTVWYKVKRDGSIKKFSGAEDSEIIQFAQDNNIKIIPSITNDCEPEDAEEVIKSSVLSSKHVEEILKLADKHDYDGIDVNYECLSGKPIREAYSDFIKNLATRLHAKNKLLTTSVHAKDSEYGTWEGPAAQDWRVLGKNCDQIKIMAYDFHWSTSEAGDIAPLDWTEETLSYAVKHIDPSKIYLGIHFYGYDWIGKKAESLTYNDVQDSTNKFNPKIKTSEQGEKYFTYSSSGESHTVYFADHTTIKKRVDLANKYKISGIGIWRLGQEDPKNWETIKESFK